MIIVHFLHICLFVIFGIPLVYLALLSIAANTVRLRKDFPAYHLRRFVIVVPAHNEEIAICKTVESLVSIDYPPDLFDVVVVADNCTDQTAMLARSKGARVLERFDALQRGKGYALRWCFDKVLHEQPGYDALVVIDADTTVSRNYLTALNVAIEEGAEVMQTSDLVEPCPGVWTTEALRLSFVLYNYVRPLGRKALGLSAGLRGNGMCFTCSVLRSVPWHAYSKAEDLEYGLQMLIAGYNTRFIPEAVALATMPQKAANAESQRARWEGGRLAVIGRYTAPLLGASFRKLSLVAVDAFVDLVTPAFVNMMAIAGLLAIVTGGAAVAGIDSAQWYAMAWGIAVLSGVIHVGAGLAAAGDKSLALTLIAVPRYVAWKILLYVKLAGKTRTDEWVRTTREHGNDRSTNNSESHNQKP
jgi:cellulose synthase/poly-beta-1,6-N-acetylglucosamine synthase-like glycosyltransferase